MKIPVFASRVRSQYGRWYLKGGRSELVAARLRESPRRSGIRRLKLIGQSARSGPASGGAALLVESNDRLAAGDGDFAVDHGAFRDGNGTRDDVGMDDGG